MSIHIVSAQYNPVSLFSNRHPDASAASVLGKDLAPETFQGRRNGQANSFGKFAHHSLLERTWKIKGDIHFISLYRKAPPF